MSPYAQHRSLDVRERLAERTARVVLFERARIEPDGHGERAHDRVRDRILCDDRRCRRAAERFDDGRRQLVSDDAVSGGAERRGLGGRAAPDDANDGDVARRRLARDASHLCRPARRVSRAGYVAYSGAVGR